MSSTATIALIIIIVFIGTVIAFLYNQFVALRQRVHNAWAQIDVELKRRYNLVPNLVETVKAYASHERETLENVTKARTNALAADDINEQAGAENMLASTLKTLFAVAENYPDLKADENFRKLQQELINTESKISFARQFYNDTVQKYNTKIEMFPHNLLAGLFQFQSAQYFNISEDSGARQVVNVNLDR
ncbi:LemA family protein [Desulfuribacillus alkaliarsenatis]|uniref:LemA family protein n=1 Tax=Desulfuribacillus alkaliarsenatis TaxID=766136 RepID=A0A1E5G195_9FIRM|nr:LemA family protein [Desulfuribacillus alkaliarsenatis]OEF96604.1 hypothetical protein BHF68_08140 [Desulfuribacillus alkaliarsenatis]